MRRHAGPDRAPDERSVAEAQASPEWPTLTNAIVPAALAGALVVAEFETPERVAPDGQLPR